MSTRDIEGTIFTALRTAAEVYDKHADEAGLPQGLRQQFAKQAREARELIVQIECGAIEINKRLAAISDRSLQTRNSEIVAATIREQLGGNKFVAMTGAKDFVSDGSSLTFKLPRKAKDGINLIRITLTADDAYRIEFMRRRGLDISTVKTADHLQAEQLCEAFENATELRTSLGVAHG